MQKAFNKDINQKALQSYYHKWDDKREEYYKSRDLGMVKVSISQIKDGDVEDESYKQAFYQAEEFFRFWSWDPYLVKSWEYEHHDKYDASEKSEVYKASSSDRLYRKFDSWNKIRDKTHGSGHEKRTVNHEKFYGQFKGSEHYLMFFHLTNL